MISTFRDILGFALVFSAFPQPLLAEGSPWDYARALARTGVIRERQESSDYRFEAPVSRAEAAKIATNLMGLNPETCRGVIFSDVGPELGDLCGYVEAAAESGIFSKSPPRFRPSDPVTRAEMAKIFLMANAIGPSVASA
jgi:hypothetical protein